jgi:hypothetical protein
MRIRRKLNFASADQPLSATIEERVGKKSNKNSDKESPTPATDTAPSSHQELIKKMEQLGVQISQAPTAGAVEEVRLTAYEVLSELRSMRDIVYSATPMGYRERVQSLNVEEKALLCEALNANPASLWDAVPFLTVLKKWKYGCRTDAIRTLVEETLLAVGGVLLAIGRLQFRSN